MTGLADGRERVTVGVDGPDAAGKTTLADLVARRLRPRHVLRASLDSFLRPAEVRYARGELSAEGCYRDSYDYTRFHREVLTPFARGGDRAVLVVDGLFLLRPELRDAWTLSVYLDVSPEEALRRARVRDRDALGDALEQRYVERYLPAQEIYRREADPLATADVVVRYDDPDHPVVVRSPAP